uniref:NADH-ubiquinone oxidoreductase chain 3 n=1 Tax=Paramacrosteles nigromaculatus TaxID=2665880 RepID=A0A5Q2MXU0_9HEMI|nr:NADH dehydrogenase subunit 3 [Paramacrosteles nigromaculatus]QGG46173.1 NADH dehydrogenase subunit 3 [Paramacrosteles nigromaculatus]
MNLMLMSMMLICLLLLIMMTLIILISKKSFVDTQKATPFECGFNPMSYSRLPFSMHFFMIAVIFLIFDIEIIMVLPMIMTIKTSMLKYWLLTSTMFTFILLMGLFHEWKNGMIKWTI